MIDRRKFLALGGLAAAATATGAPAASAAAGAPRRGPRWSALRDGIDGDLLLPGEPGYEAAYGTYLARYDTIRPAAVLRPARAEDVAEAVRFARRHRVRTVARSGGHSFGGYSTGTGLVVDTSSLHRTRVTGGIARIQAGSKIVDFQQDLLREQVAITGGMCPTVGVSGLTLGGGFGMAGRRYGLTSDRLSAVRLVLADGRLITCDEHHHPDLFWALRGGGAGSFGIVTEFDFVPYAAHEPTVFQIFFPWSAAADVVAAWQEWAPETPDELSAGLFVRTFDPSAEPQVFAFGQWAGSHGDLDAVLGRFSARVGHSPTVSDIRRVPYLDSVLYWAGCSELSVSQCHAPGQTPDGRLARLEYALTKSDFFARSLPREGIERLLAAIVADQPAGELRGLEFHAFGGAYNRPSPGHTAFVHRRQRFLLQYLAQVPTTASDGQKAAVDEWARRAWRAMRPWASGEAYQNYTDPELRDWRSAYYGGNYGRLTRVKRRYDPQRFFDHPHAIGR
ncbi:FAD-binding oxidoreductase [Micromonospora sp. CA-240977]|uniref:FAD-binding oxidoreductase n=1 Tax=Micromonospora sp. CA-240977 TaxID=3239957 RepID=UPI003D93AD45